MFGDTLNTMKTLKGSKVLREDVVIKKKSTLMAILEAAQAEVKIGGGTQDIASDKDLDRDVKVPEKTVVDKAPEVKGEQMDGGKIEGQDTVKKEGKENEKNEAKVNEGKKEDEAAAAVTKSAVSLLRKIHKAENVEALEDIMNTLEKSATKGSISSEQETRLKAAWARRKEALKDNPKAPADEPTQAEEDAIEKEEPKDDTDESFANKSMSRPLNESTSMDDMIKKLRDVTLSVSESDKVDTDQNPGKEGGVKTEGAPAKDPDAKPKQDVKSSDAPVKQDTGALDVDKEVKDTDPKLNKENVSNEGEPGLQGGKAPVVKQNTSALDGNSADVNLSKDGVKKEENIDKLDDKGKETVKQNVGALTDSKESKVNEMAMIKIDNEGLMQLVRKAQKYLKRLEASTQTSDKELKKIYDKDVEVVKTALTFLEKGDLKGAQSFLEKNSRTDSRGRDRARGADWADILLSDLEDLVNSAYEKAIQPYQSKLDKYSKTLDDPRTGRKYDTEESKVPDVTSDSIEAITKALYEMVDADKEEKAEKKDGREYFGMSGKETLYAAIDKGEGAGEGEEGVEGTEVKNVKSIKSITVYDSIGNEVAKLQNDGEMPNAKFISLAAENAKLDSVGFQILQGLGILNTEEEEQPVDQPAMKEKGEEEGATSDVTNDEKEASKATAADQDAEPVEQHESKKGKAVKGKMNEGTKELKTGEDVAQYVVDNLKFPSDSENGYVVYKGVKYSDIKSRGHSTGEVALKLGKALGIDMSKAVDLKYMKKNLLESTVNEGIAENTQIALSHAITSLDNSSKFVAQGLKAEGVMKKDQLELAIKELGEAEAQIKMVLGTNAQPVALPQEAAPTLEPTAAAEPALEAPAEGGEGTEGYESRMNEDKGAPIYLRDLNQRLQSTYTEDIEKLRAKMGNIEDKDIIVGYFIEPIQVMESKIPDVTADDIDTITKKLYEKYIKKTEAK